MAWPRRCACRNTDIRLFGKPESFVKRRMGVALAFDADVEVARARPSWPRPKSSRALPDGLDWQGWRTMQFSRLISWADDSSLHVLMAAVAAVLLALLVYRVSATVVLRLTRSLPVSNMTAQPLPGARPAAAAADCAAGASGMPRPIPFR